MPYIPRQDLERRLADAATEPSPRLCVITAPRGAGKSALLRQTASRLAARGRVPVLIDFERIGTSPADFARHVPRAIRSALSAAGVGDEDLPAPAREILSHLDDELSRRKPDPVLVLERTLSFPVAVAREVPSLVLLLDELAEVSRLARQEGLRDALAIVTRWLAAAGPAGLAVVATVSPASRPVRLLEMLRLEAGPGGMEIVVLPPLSRAELGALIQAWGIAPGAGVPAPDVEMWMRATGGRPLYAEILARRIVRDGPAGADLTSALASEMTPPVGSLHQECRFDYHLLVERSRGHSVVRSILRILAREEGQRLSAIAQQLRIQLPTALDYLSWLLEVGLIRRDGAGYVFADPLLRLWVTLAGPEPADLLEEVVKLLESPLRVPQPPSRPRGPRPARPRSVDEAPAPAPPPPGQPGDRRRPALRPRDTLIEID